MGLQELLNQLPAAIQTLTEMAQQFADLVARVEKLERSEALSRKVYP